VAEVDDDEALRLLLRRCDHGKSSPEPCPSAAPAYLVRSG